jgi:hypothetical protein
MYPGLYDGTYDNSSYVFFIGSGNYEFRLMKGNKTLL